MRPGAKTSVVWNYFVKNRDKSATCTLCNKMIQCHGGTSNLRQHLLRVHPGQTSLISQNDATENESDILLILGPSTSRAATPPIQRNTSIVKPELSSINKKRKLDKLNMRSIKQLKLFDGKKNEFSELQIAEIDIKLLKMITKGFQPLSVVEDKGFLEYSEALQPSYKPPSKKRLSEIISCYYTEAASALKTALESIENVAVTADFWTSDSYINYITLTAHFIDDDKLYARVLSTKDIYGSHTAENIANVLRPILTEWNINDKTVAVVSDNGLNIKVAVTEHLQKHHHPCVADTLNLSVNEALFENEKLNVVLKKCRALVGYFKYSTIANDTLKDIQEQMGFPVLKMKEDIPNRWNSCYIMLERFLEIKEPLNVCVTKLPKFLEFLDVEAWKIINDCVQVLKPASMLINIFSIESYPKISLIVPLIRAFQSSLENINTCTDAGETLKETLLDVVTSRLGILEKNKIVAKATFLDPRFKKIAFGAEENAVNAQKWVTEELCEIIACQPVDESNKIVPQNEDDLWLYFDQKLSEKKSFLTPKSKVTFMVSQYLEIAPIERKADPLVFWSKHKDLLPEMYQLAMKYLCIPSTSVPYESMFSKTSQPSNLRRNGLDSEHLDEILFLNSHEF